MLSLDYKFIKNTKLLVSTSFNELIVYINVIQNTKYVVSNSFKERIFYIKREWVTQEIPGDMA